MPFALVALGCPVRLDRIRDNLCVRFYQVVKSDESDNARGLSLVCAIAVGYFLDVASH